MRELRNGFALRTINIAVVVIVAISSSCIDSEYVDGIVSSAGRPTLDPAFELVGEDARGRLIFAIGGEVASPVETTESDRLGVKLIALEPQTLSSEVITNTINANRGKLASNGAWVIWEDFNSGLTLAKSLSGDVDRVLLEPGKLFGSPKIYDNRAVLLQRTENLIGEDASQRFAYSLLIIDLTTGATNLVEDVWSYGTVAVMDDTALVMTHSSVDACCLELGAAIDAIDLTTGRRSNVVRRTRVDGSGGKIFLTGDAFVWQEFVDKKLNKRIRTYNPALGTLESLDVQFNDSDISESWLVDVSGDQILMRDSAGSRIFGQSTKYRVWNAVGSEQTVLEFANTRIAPQQFRLNLRLLGPLLIWADPFDGDLLIQSLDGSISERIMPQDLLSIE